MAGAADAGETGGDGIAAAVGAVLLGIVGGPGPADGAQGSGDGRMLGCRAAGGGMAGGGRAQQCQAVPPPASVKKKLK